MKSKIVIQYKHIDGKDTYRLLHSSGRHMIVTDKQRLDFERQGIIPEEFLEEIEREHHEPR